MQTVAEAVGPLPELGDSAESHHRRLGAPAQAGADWPGAHNHASVWLVHVAGPVVAASVCDSPTQNQALTWRHQANTATTVATANMPKAYALRITWGRFISSGSNATLCP